MNSQPPSKIELQHNARKLKLSYPDGDYLLSFEFLRVLSPSAEVRGHGGKGAVLQTGKREIAISALEPAGNYGLKIVFDDGHDSGIYTWQLLREFCEQQAPLWQGYLDELAQAGASR